MQPFRFSVKSSPTFFFFFSFIMISPFLSIGQTTIETTIETDKKDSTINAVRDKPPHLWELGVHIGMPIITGDVSPTPGYGGGVSFRKAINHIFSWRIDYTGANYYGLNYRLGIPNQFATNIANNPYYTNYINGNREYLASYKTTINQFSLQGLLSLNSVSIHRGHPKSNMYLFGGYSLLIATVRVNALDAGGRPYDFSNQSSPVNFISGTRSDIRRQLRNYLDNNYESMGGVLNGTRTNIGIFGNSLLRHSINGGGGYAYKINDRFNIAGEYRMTFGFSDDLDGIYKGRTQDILHYFSVRFNFNIGNKGKKVEPLWWINPNVMKASETNTMIKTLIKNAQDSLDTDGDGVLDIYDKEKITLQKCFPVDSDGVGSCPPVPCCSDTIRISDSIQTEIGCRIGKQTLTFQNKSYELTEEMRATLQQLAGQLKANPSCDLILRGVMKSGTTDRVEVVRKYLVETTGISDGRITSIAYSREENKRLDEHSVQIIGTYSGDK